MTESWYWFGVYVDTAGHVKLRQVHVRKGRHFRAGRGFHVEAWSKGIAGKWWQVRRLGFAATFADAVAMAREYMVEWAAGYATIDEGEPPRVEFDDAQPAGAADPDWWAAVLRVDPSADPHEIKSAFRKRAKETHPDMGGSADEFRAVYAAWEFWKEER